MQLFKQKKTYNKFNQPMDFLQISGQQQQSIIFLTIIDLDKKQIKISYTNQKDSLHTLRNTYYDVTQCQQIINLLKIKKQKIEKLENHLEQDYTLNIKKDISQFDIRFKNLHTNTVYNSHKVNIKTIKKFFDNKEIGVTLQPPSKQLQYDNQCCMIEQNYNPQKTKILIIKASQSQFPIRIKNQKQLENQLNRIKKQKCKILIKKLDKVYDSSEISIQFISNTIRQLKQENPLQKKNDIILELYVYDLIIGSQKVSQFQIIIQRQDNNQIIKFQKNIFLTIGSLKQQLSKKYKIKTYDILLFECGKLLQDDKKTLVDYGVSKQSPSFRIQMIIKGCQIKYQNKNQVFITIKENHSKFISARYDLLKDFMVKDVIKLLVQKFQPSYCLIFDNFILKPNMELKIVQNQKNFNGKSFNVILLKNGIKVLFYKSVPIKPQFPKKLFKPDAQTAIGIQKSIIQIQKNVQKAHLLDQKFYTPIQYYSCKQFFQQINEYLDKIDLSNIQNKHQQKEFLFTSALIASLKLLQNQIRVVHRGVANFKLGKKIKQGSTFCWPRIISTSKNPLVSQMYSTQTNKSTMFHISSLTGKDVSKFSLFPDQQEVIFLPYTHFFVQKIISGKQNQNDQVWLSQMPTPSSYDRNIILWVDDLPENNVKLSSKISKQKNCQIIPLTSTKMAEAWIHQFGWILHRMNLQFRLISDMSRYQDKIYIPFKKFYQQQNPQNKQLTKNKQDTIRQYSKNSYINTQPPNYEAGVDLLQIFFNEFKFTTPIMIFCSDTKRAQANIQKRKIDKSKIYRVESNQDNIPSYCDFSQRIMQWWTYY